MAEKPMGSDGFGWRIEGFTFLVLTIQNCLCICAIFIQNDYCLDCYCNVTLGDGMTFCLEMSPGSWQEKGCIYLGMKWREAKRMMELVW